MASSFWSQHVNPTSVPQFNWQGMGYAMNGLENGFTSLSKLGDTLKNIDQNNAERVLRERMLGMQNQDQMLKAMEDGSLLEGIRGRVGTDTLAKVNSDIRNQATYDISRENLLDIQDLNKNAEAIAELWENKQFMNPEEFARALKVLTETQGIRANTLIEANKIGTVKDVADAAQTFKNQQEDELTSNLVAVLKTYDSPQVIANALAYIRNKYGIRPEAVEKIKAKLGDTLKDVSPESIINTPKYAEGFEKDYGKRIPHGLLTSLGTTSGIQGPYGSYEQFAGITTTNASVNNKAADMVNTVVTDTQPAGTVITPTEGTAATTTPVPTPTSTTVTATTAPSINKASDLLGSVSAKEESNSNPGSISSGTGDHGGRSYGAFQFSSKMGTTKDYIKNSKYKDKFNGLEVGSKEFNEAWQKLAKEDPEGFYADQQAYAEKNFYDKTKNGLVKKGIDLSNRGRAIQELLFSIGISFGSSAPNLISKALNGKNVSRMSDTDIISAVQNHIKDNVGTLYKSSPKYQKGRAERAQRDAERLIAMAAEEAPTREISESPKGLPFTGANWDVATGKAYADDKLKLDDGTLQKYMDEYTKATGYTWRNEPGSKFFADELDYQLRKDPKARELLEYNNINPNAKLVTKSQSQQTKAQNNAESKIWTTVQGKSSNADITPKPQQYIRGEANAANRAIDAFNNKVSSGVATFDDAKSAYSLAKEGIQNQRVELARRLGIPANVLNDPLIMNQGVKDANPDLKKMEVFNGLNDYALGKVYRFIREVQQDTGCSYQEALVSIASNLKDGDFWNRVSPYSSNLYDFNDSGLAVDIRLAKQMATKLKTPAYRREMLRMKQLGDKESGIDTAFAGVVSRENITIADASKLKSRTGKLSEDHLNKVAFQNLGAKISDSYKNFTN